jgi:hypothetical protein
MMHIVYTLYVYVYLYIILSQVKKDKWKST